MKFMEIRCIASSACVSDYHFESRQILRRSQKERKDLKVATSWNVPNLIPPRNLFHILERSKIWFYIQSSQSFRDHQGSQIWFHAQMISIESPHWFQIFMRPRNQQQHVFSLAMFSCSAPWQESLTLFWNKCGWNLTCSSRVALQYGCLQGSKIFCYN